MNPQRTQTRPPGTSRFGCLLAALLGLVTFACRSPVAPGATKPPRNEAYWDETEVERRAQAGAHFAAGLLEELEGRQEGGLDHLAAAALADPANESLVLTVAGRLLQKQRSEDAVRLLRVATEVPNAGAPIFAMLGMALAVTGDLDGAAAANRDALDRDPAYLRAYQSLVAIYSEQDRPEVVLEVLREAAVQTSLDPAYPAAVAGMFAGYARLHADQAETLRPEIRALLDRAVELKPANPLVLHQLAEGFKRLGDVEQAEALYRTLLQQFPGELLAQQSLVDLYLQTDNRKEATELLQDLLRRQPGNERATYVLGSLAFQEGRLEEARDLLQRAITLDPSLRSAYYELAAVHLSLGDHEQALEVLNRSREQFTEKTFVGEFYSGIAHMRAERYEAATRHFTEAEILARASDPERLTHLFYFQFGAASERRGDYEGAARYFRRCLELSPDFAEALNYLGYMWAERGENLHEARRLIERAVELEPENGAFLDSLGWVLFQLKQPAEALPWLEKAIALTEEPDPTLYDHLGDVYWALGRSTEARAAWEKALASGPDDRIERKLAQPGTPSLP